MKKKDIILNNIGYKTKNVLGVDITTSSQEDILEHIKKYFRLGYMIKGLGDRKKIEPLVIFTPNPEIVNFAQKSSFFKKIVNTAQINLPDGVGIVWAIKQLHDLSVERISGVDFMLKLVKISS